MNKRWETPETSVRIRVVTKNGEDGDLQNCVAGIEFDRVDGTLSIDLRSLRPIRVLDRDNLIVELYLHDVLVALADKLKTGSDS